MINIRAELILDNNELYLDIPIRCLSIATGAEADAAWKRFRKINEELLAQYKASNPIINLDNNYRLKLKLERSVEDNLISEFQKMTIIYSTEDRGHRWRLKLKHVPPIKLGIDWKDKIIWGSLRFNNLDRREGLVLEEISCNLDKRRLQRAVLTQLTSIIMFDQSFPLFPLVSLLDLTW